MTIEELQAEIEEAQNLIEQFEKEKMQARDDAWRARTFTEKENCFDRIKILDMKIEDTQIRIIRLKEQIGKIEEGTIEEEPIDFDPENPTIEGLLDLLRE